jgi:threonine/homoserine/homoserine lactone efflux protein
MPSADTLLTFTVAALALIVLPGPGMLLLLARGVGFGRRAAGFSALRLETGTGVYVAGTAAGLSALLASSAVAFSALRYAGAAYLLSMGVRVLTRRPALYADTTRPLDPPHPRSWSSARSSWGWRSPSTSWSHPPRGPSAGGLPVARRSPAGSAT